MAPMEVTLTCFALSLEFAATQLTQVNNPPSAPFGEHPLSSAVNHCTIKTWGSDLLVANSHLGHGYQKGPREKGNEIRVSSDSATAEGSLEVARCPKPSVGSVESQVASAPF